MRDGKDGENKNLCLGRVGEGYFIAGWVDFWVYFIFHLYVVYLGRSDFKMK